jgi:hypothetical protein
MKASWWSGSWIQPQGLIILLLIVKSNTYGLNIRLWSITMCLGWWNMCFICSYLCEAQMLQWPFGWIESKVSSSNCDSCFGDSLFSILVSRDAKTSLSKHLEVIRCTCKIWSWKCHKIPTCSVNWNLVSTSCVNWHKPPMGSPAVQGLMVYFFPLGFEFWD